MASVNIFVTIIKILKLFKFIILLNIFYFSFLSISYTCSFNCPKSGLFTDDAGHLGLKTSKHSGYEKHVNYMGQNDYNYSYISDKSFARRGDYYQKFELRDGDCFGDESWNDCENDRERVEFSSRPHQKPEGIQCFSYSIKLHKDFIDVYPTNTDLGQVHQKGGPSGSAGGFASLPPLIQLGAKKGKFYFGWHDLSGSESNVIDIRKDYNLANLNDMKEKWTDVSFCLDYIDKRMDVWINGDKKHEILKSPVNFIPEKTYFKFGIYRSFIKNFKDRQKMRNKEEKMPTQIVYYDEIRRGNSIEEVDFNINQSLKAID